MVFNNALNRLFKVSSTLPSVFFVNNFRLYGCKPAIGPPWRIIFFGTDSFALYSLKALWAKLNTGTLVSDLAVVSKKGCVVRNFAEAEGLATFDWPLEVKKIESKYHIGMVVSFGNLIPEDIIKSFPLGCVNVHASLLPRWRGAAPIIHAITNGDTETGITIMRIHPHKFDTGEIVRQYRISIEPHETSVDIHNKLGICGSDLLMECLRDLPRCLDKAISQPNVGVTYAPKIDSSMASINWSEMSALQVYNLHRALQHVYPLTTRWHGQVVKLHQVYLDKIYENSKSYANLNAAHTSEENSKQSALHFLSSGSSLTEPSTPKSNKLKLSNINSGIIKYDKQARFIKVLCSDGNYVIIKKLTVGGKTMSAVDFHNGFISKKSDNQCIFGS